VIEPLALELLLDCYFHILYLLVHYGMSIIATIDNILRNLVVFKGENCACTNGIAKQRYIRSNSFSTEDYLSSTK